MLLPFIIDVVKAAFTDGLTATPTATTTTNGVPTFADGLAAASTTATTETKVDKVVRGLAVAGGIAAVGGVAYAVGKQDGVEEGYHDGYARASMEYEEKFHRQVRYFEEDKERLKKDNDEYRKLCEDLLAALNLYKNLAESAPRYRDLYMKATQDYRVLTNLASSEKPYAK